MSSTSYHIALSPGALIDDRKGLDRDAYCIPKVGGRAVLSDACRVGDDRATTCKGCQKDMSFIASTPVLKARESDNESVVYLFGCLEEGCGGSKGSWRAFRWTEEETTSETVQEEMREPTTSTSTDAFASSWGLEDDGGIDDAFDMEDLSAQLNDLIANSAATKEKKKSTNGTKPQARPKSGHNSKQAFNGLMPPFYLVHSADIPPVMDMDSDEEEEARYGARSRVGVPCHTMDGSDGNENDELDWGGEAYERDTVIRTGQKVNTDNEASFVAYMRELSRVPDQCLRVYGGGVGVPYAWPTKAPDVASTCPRCDTTRRCVVQVMSPLIAAMNEAMEMARDGAKVGANEELRGPPGSWDWATLAICICEKSCVEGDGLVEEDVRVLGEA